MDLGESMTKFISPYIPAADAQYLASHSPTVEYFDYDWDVNGKPPCNCKRIRMWFVHIQNVMQKHKINSLQPP